MYRSTKVTCIGSGLIGTGFAVSFLMNGCNVSLYDPDPAKLEQATQTTKTVLHTLDWKTWPQGWGDIAQRVLNKRWRIVQKNKAKRTRMQCGLETK
jgi:3-hydroxyacyl-CoA dehydrogenase